MQVVAVGLLGAAGLQLASTRYQYTSALRSQALIQADFIIEKMRVNNSVLTLANLAAATANPDGGYLAPNDYDNADDQPNDPGCGLNGQLACTAAQAAQRDLREWRQSLARELPGFEPHLSASLITTPQDFHDRLLSFKGAAFGLEPLLLQSAWFRPHNRSEDVEGLFMVGASTHPGAGVPGVLMSAKALDSVVPDAATFLARTAHERTGR